MAFFVTYLVDEVNGAFGRACQTSTFTRSPRRFRRCPPGYRKPSPPDTTAKNQNRLAWMI